MDLLDTVAHLYENEKIHERIDSPILQAMGYNCKNEFPEESNCDNANGQRELSYRCSGDISEECNDNSIDVTSIVERLDGEFRQRINSEIENFRISINDIVSEQQISYRTMFRLQQDMDPSQEVPIHMYSRSSSTDNISSDYQVVVETDKQAEQMSVVESPPSTYNSYGTSEGEQGYSSFGSSDLYTSRENENAVADKYLIRLMTATLLVGNTLRRREYKVL